MELPNVLTVGGVALVTILLTGAIKAAIPNFQTDRFGPLLAIVLGILLVALANWSSVGTLPALSPIEVVLTGIVGGASAAGLYDAGKAGVSATRTTG